MDLFVYLADSLVGKGVIMRTEQLTKRADSLVGKGIIMRTDQLTKRSEPLQKLIVRLTP